jgi:cytochrome c-type biogenesis protein CcmF
MWQFGHFFLLLAFASGIYAILASVVGARRQRLDLIHSAENAAIAVTFLLSLAIVALLQALLSSNFNIEYVYGYTNLALPTLLKGTALWGGQKGSLLFWGWLLSVFVSVAILTNRTRNRELMPYVVAVSMAVNLFFIVLNLFVSQVFERFWQMPDGRVLTSVFQPAGAIPFMPGDGRGLNPLLQHWAMAVHPPILYLGYVGLTIPFAFAMAALITKRLGNEWIKTIRLWSVLPWFFLGIGMLLGGKWAYMELGWGGYWAWDPVENSALMPWLAATAFIHSIMIQEKKNMLRTWNMFLIILAFLLSVFGTFVTRSGVISSVHAFTQSGIGPFFSGFLVISSLFAFGYLISRRPLLRSENHFDSVVSRESAFLINNLALLGACFAVFWGTIFPIVSEAVRGVKVTVGPSFFNAVNIPLGLFLLFLTGVGPLVAWRKTSGKLLRKIFMKPTLAALIGLAGMLVGGMRDFYALVSFTLSIFVIGTIVAEFHRGARARRRTNSESYPVALWRLLLRNKRRYGGYIVHVGIVVIFVGFTGSAFNQETEGTLKIGESMSLKDYRVEYADFSAEEDANKIAWKAKLDVYKQDKFLGTIFPQRHFYKVQEQPTTEVALYSTLREDLYVILAQPNEDRSAIFKMYVNPLVQWVWIGGLVVVLGTFIILLPDSRDRGAGRALQPKRRPRAVTVQA